MTTNVWHDIFVVQLTRASPPPSVSIDDVTVNEGDGSADFTVSLSEPAASDVTVDYATVEGTVRSAGRLYKASTYRS